MQNIRCPACQFVNRPQARYCANCGYSLLSEPPYFESPPAEWVPPVMDFQQEEGSILQTGKAVFGIVSLVMFVVLFSFSLPAYSFSKSVMDPDIYIDSIEGEDFYDKFPELFGEQIDYWIHDLQSDYFILEFFFQNIVRSDWQLVAERIITPDWLQEQTESLIEQIFEYANGDQSDLKMIVSFTGVKDRLSGPLGYETYQAITENKPECNMLELTQWLLAPVIDLLPICKLPENGSFFGFSTPDPEEVVPQILTDWANTLPDEKDLAASLEDKEVQEIDSFFSGFRLVRFTSGVMIAVAVGFLILSLLSSNVRSQKGWLRYWGGSFLTAGVILIVLAVLLAVFSIWQIDELLKEFQEIFVFNVIDMIRSIGNQIVLEIVKSFGILGGIILIVGFGMFSASFFVGENNPTSNQLGY